MTLFLDNIKFIEYTELQNIQILCPIPIELIYKNDEKIAIEFIYKNDKSNEFKKCIKMWVKILLY